MAWCDRRSAHAPVPDSQARGGDGVAEESTPMVVRWDARTQVARFSCDNGCIGYTKAEMSLRICLDQPDSYFCSQQHDALDNGCRPRWCV